MKATFELPWSTEVWGTFNLGGRTEYIVTIACVIGRSRMKGERIVTNLLPYAPVKPRFSKFYFNFKVGMITGSQI